MARTRKGKPSSEIQDLLDDPVELENPDKDDTIDFWNQCVRVFQVSSPVKAHLMMPELRRLAGRLFYKGHNPKTVPMNDLRFMSQQREFGDRIKGPLTAIRSFCLGCMGGQSNLVRECESTTCPFWSFRMGGNPFFGKLPDAEATVNLEEELEEANADS